MTAGSADEPAALDHALMARALRLAESGQCSARPNPSVGCVLAHADEVVGEGFTAPVGGPHAEIGALRAAGERARGATAYVTLEPCCHVGRTGPCTRALIEAGIARVVCAVVDPNPRVGGGGLRALRAAGVNVTVGLLEAQAIALNRGYFSRMQRGKPWVSVKLAASLDGRTALENGASQWITGPAARRDVHRWRARAGAILTGLGTVLHDDPSLTARPDDGLALVQPLRAVVDARGEVPATARTLQLPGTVVIFTTRSDELPLETAAGARVAELRVERVRPSAGEGLPRCDLNDVMARLAGLEINDVWVEAGAGLSGALLAAGLVDELVLYYAAQILGDRGRGMFAIVPPQTLDQRVELRIHDVRRCGADLRILARPVASAAAFAGGAAPG